MDLLEAKHRVAEALVESIFRRARYEIVPYRRQAAGSLRVGREDFSPDFSVRQSEEQGGKEFLIEVRYHARVQQFLAVESQRGERSLLQMTRRQWPELYVVFVTEWPEPGRSCFQAFPLASWVPGRPGRSADLTELPELSIFPHNVADHEALVRRIFTLLAGV